MWNNGTTPPVTATPLVMQSGGWAGLVSATAGAGIAYRVIKPDGKIPSRWEVYAKPFPLQRGEKVEAVAQRIGYARSETVLSDAH
ncbi:MAG: hypothetical protein RLZZ557_133, partial [Bacteroidota bacterium]